MSAVLALESGEILTAWQGELPQEGDVIWVEDARKLFRVTTVVHVVGISQSTLQSMPLPVAYPTCMRRIFVEEMEEDRTLMRALKALKASDV